jgi:glycerol-3-phosphate dehydrogenase
LRNLFRKPIPFIIPYVDKIRPAWLIKIGLFLYDKFRWQKHYTKSKTLDLRKELPNVLQAKYKTGFQYFDIQIDDKKLTKLNVKDAKRNKAKILEYNKVKKQKLLMIDGLSIFKMAKKLNLKF